MSNPNTFVLFVNDRKTKDTHPDRSGTLNVDGVEYFIDGWLKEKNGKKFLSGSIKRKEKQGGDAPAAAAANKPAPDDWD